MTMQRRTFMAATTRTAAGMAFAATLPHMQQRRQSGVRKAPDVLTLHDPQVRALALSAVDAARQAGANYADVRVSYTRDRSFAQHAYDESEALGLSVRALVNGYWGWAATSYVAASEAPRVAQAAVGLAKGNAATRQPRHVDWTPIPVVTDGTWTTPIRDDPFEVAIPQLMDWVNGMEDYIKDTAAARPKPATVDFPTSPWVVKLTLQQQQRVFASTEGSYLTQTVFVTDPHIGFKYNGASVVLPVRPTQAGYEYVTDTPWTALIRQGMDRVDGEPRLPSKVLDVGRYDVVFGAAAMAEMTAWTIGVATQVDRALGYEANARGTSYLGPDPLAFLGTSVASPLVTVTADRTDPQGLATTQWDDEGVRAESFPLVQNGVLQDYQTTREQAAWLAPYYQHQSRPVHSHSCSAGTDALTQQMQHMPNLTLEPGKDMVGLEDLVASLDNGIVVEDVFCEMDFQALTGLAHVDVGRVFQVRHGKRIAEVGGANLAISFRSSEFWKNILAVGGSQSVEKLFPMPSLKGEPEQSVRYSVSAVPARLKQLAVIDYTR